MWSERKAHGKTHRLQDRHQGLRWGKIRKNASPPEDVPGAESISLKKTLVRILRTPEGEIVLDKLGKSSGRGAYICKSSSCLRKAIKSRRIDASLKTKIPEEIYLRLEEEIKE